MCSVEEFQTESYEISEKSEIQTSGRTMFIQNENEKKNAKMRKNAQKHASKSVQKDM